MYSAAFMYAPGDYDDDFHRLNALVDEVARSLPGFLGAESWQAPDGKRKNAVYYWASLEDLKIFSNHPRHLEAKRQYQRWYGSFHIVISQVIRSYGDGGFPHFTPNERHRPAG